MEPTQPLLSVQQLGRHLSKQWLWQRVSFDIWEGDGVGLVAPSGTGKTLLLRNLVLLDPLQQGQIRFAGKQLQDWSLPLYRTRVMYLPQRATAFEGTVSDNLKQVYELRVYHQRHFDAEKIEYWLSKLGRGPDFLTRNSLNLSGGEAQILALLRVLQLDPQILLLDEPTSSLDAETTLRVEALLQEWLTQPSKACLLTSHDQEQIRRITNRQINLGEFI